MVDHSFSNKSCQTTSLRPQCTFSAPSLAEPSGNGPCTCLTTTNETGLARQRGQAALSAPKTSPAFCVLQSPRLGVFALKKEYCKTQSRQDAEDIFMVSGRTKFMINCGFFSPGPFPHNALSPHLLIPQVVMSNFSGEKRPKKAHFFAPLIFYMGLPFPFSACSAISAVRLQAKSTSCHERPALVRLHHDRRLHSEAQIKETQHIVLNVL
jgi:hypothetical protein